MRSHSSLFSPLTLHSRVPDCGGNVVTGTQVHTQVSDTSTTGSSSYRVASGRFASAFRRRALDARKRLTGQRNLVDHLVNARQPTVMRGRETTHEDERPTDIEEKFFATDRDLPSLNILMHLSSEFSTPLFSSAPAHPPRGRSTTPVTIMWSRPPKSNPDRRPKPSTVG